MPTSPSSETNLQDRRSSARVSFAARIAVSEHPDRGIPPEDQFRPAKALNLSQSGLSFLTNYWPTSDQLLVRLGEDGSPAHVLAHVIDCRREQLPSGDIRFQVRCRFTDWLR